MEITVEKTATCNNSTVDCIGVIAGILAMKVIE